jgi:3D (Asp-Asp-Asp) domain-containing protein
MSRRIIALAIAVFLAVVSARAVEFTATAYCSCYVCCGKWALNRPNGVVYTKSGAVAVQGRTVAVDPRVIPLGTKIDIDGRVYIAQDVGGNIRGKHVDIYFSEHADAFKFGRRAVTVRILPDTSITGVNGNACIR